MLRLSVLFLVASAAVSAAESGPASAEFFETKVRPVLARNCFACHAASKMGGLDLTTRAGLEKGGARGPAVMGGAGAGAASLLVRAVSYQDDKLKMPPSGRLAPGEIEDLTAWVRAGAVWPENKNLKPAAPGYRITAEHRAWWAFQPVRKPAPPPVKNAAWARTDIDRFVLNKIEAKGLKPVRPAEKRALLRRAYFDLIGLPPSAAEVAAFEKDTARDAFAKVIERLLASQHYGERWGRYWLDVARYSDDRLNSTMDSPYENGYYYRDWVIAALNRDMPYDLFVKAQIAGDLLDRPDRDELIAGLGFYSLSPEFQDDRVDATSRGFLGLTVACAQCHDHKFDPIPTRDFYALSGVFASTRLSEFPLAPDAQVKDFKARKEKIEEKEKELNEYLDRQALQLAEILAAQTTRYLAAARRPAAKDESLDAETLERWSKYLAKEREHPFLHDWDKDSFSPEAFQARVLDLIKEKKKVDETNLIRLGGSQKRGDLAAADLVALERDKYLLWRDLFGSNAGILYYKDARIERFLDGQWKKHLDGLRAEVARLKKELPAQYPFIHTIADVEKPKNVRIRIRGSAENLGEEAQRSFLSILSKGDPAPFTKGAGRLELAEAMTNPGNPLLPRVMVNRIWKQHFGTGLVETPSNFGQLGEKPSHPELLDYLAARFVDGKWSMKALHREIMNSAVYQLAAASEPAAFEADPDNRLYWRANRRRLDIEPLRDALLAVTGELDTRMGGKAEKLTEESNKRRTVYGFVSRRKLDGTLSLFDFPNPNSSSEQRIQTATPLQSLFFLNSAFLQERAKALAARLAAAGADDTARIRAAYPLLYSRAASPREIAAGLDYLKSGAGWPLYAQVLLSSSEMLFVN